MYVCTCLVVGNIKHPAYNTTTTTTSSANTKNRRMKKEKKNKFNNLRLIFHTKKNYTWKIHPFFIFMDGRRTFSQPKKIKTNQRQTIMTLEPTSEGTNQTANELTNKRWHLNENYKMCF